MEIIYKNDKLKDVCENLKLATKKYGLDVAKALHKVIGLLRKSENLYVVSVFPQYRLIVYPIDENNNIMKSLDNEQLMFIKCIKIQIEEVSEHYE